MTFDTGSAMARLKGDSQNSSLGRRIWDHRWCYVFLAPAAVLYGAFVLWPMVASWYFSFFEWAGMTPWPTAYVGLRNFVDVVTDKYFWNAFFNTFQFVIFQTAIKLPLALLLAVMLNNSKLAGRAYYRALFFLPVVTSTAVIGIVMTFIFNPYAGALNEALMKIGIMRRPWDWLGKGSTAMWCLIVVEAWHMAGQYMIYWLAGLQSVPNELYEAAKVDGANSVQTFLNVTLPVLRPIAVIVTLLGLVNSLKVFDIVMAMTGGGPPMLQTDVLNTYIYRNAFAVSPPRIGYASAAAVFFGLTVIVVGVIQTIALRSARSARTEVRLT